jgi:hypothetical protein
MKMALVSGPLHSDAASGKFAGSLVYSNWKGRQYVRQLVMPGNPKSAKQTGVRALMAFLAATWKAKTLPKWTGWTAAAVARSISTFNAYTSENLARWQIGKPPTQVYPAAESTSGCVITTAVLTGHPGFSSAVITPAANANIWGVAIFRDTAEITAPGWANCIAIVPRSGVSAFTYDDAPLAAGTYHYRYAAINTDGVMGTVLADATVVVT